MLANLLRRVLATTILLALLASLALVAAWEFERLDLHHGDGWTDPNEIAHMARVHAETCPRCRAEHATTTRLKTPIRPIHMDPQSEIRDP